MSDVAAALARHVAQADGTDQVMVTGYVVAVEYIDPDGRRAVRWVVDPQSSHVTRIGLAEMLLAWLKRGYAKKAGWT